MFRHLSVVVLLCFVIGCLAAESRAPTSAKRKLKILINNPALAWSHSRFLGQIADELIAAGHTVHFLFYSINRALGNYTGSRLVTTIHQHDEFAAAALSAAARKASAGSQAVTDMKDVFASHFEGQQNIGGFARVFYEMMTNACQELIDDDRLLARLARERYDVAIGEFYARCVPGIFYHVGARTWLAASAVTLHSGNLAPYGVPTFSSHNFNVYTRCADKRTGRLTFFERAHNMFHEYFDHQYSRAATQQQEELFRKKFGADFPPLAEIERNQSLLLVNTNEFTSLPRALTPKVVHIGGIVGYSSSDGPLDEATQHVFNRSADGVVLFSMGTYFDDRSLSNDMLRLLAGAFRRFPTYEFICKMDVNTTRFKTVLPSNVHVFKWIDQRGILAHPRTRLFITHCGMNSVNEVAAAGVPVVALPALGDQFQNAAILGTKRVGVVFDIRELNDKAKGAARLAAAVRRVLDDPSFAENAQRLKQKVTTAPFTPAERLVKWVEFAAQFPDLNELNLPLADEMGLLQYYNADVLAVCAAVATVAALISVYSASVLSRWVWRTAIALQRSETFLKLKSKQC